MSSHSDRVMILGSTNRRHAIDAAFLRRMPKQIEIPLPNAQQRLSILALLLANVNAEEKAELISVVADHCHGMSGSDMKEVCRNAVGRCMTDYVKQCRKEGKGTMRPLNLGDFID